MTRCWERKRAKAKLIAWQSERKTSSFSNANARAQNELNKITKRKKEKNNSTNSNLWTVFCGRQNAIDKANQRTRKMRFLFLSEFYKFVRRRLFSRLARPNAICTKFILNWLCDLRLLPNKINSLRLSLQFSMFFFAFFCAFVYEN